MYKLISMLINLFSNIFLFTKESYDIVLIQKFGSSKSINYSLIENELKDFKIKYVNSNNNKLKNTFLDIYYCSKAKTTVLDAYSLGISNTKRFKDKTVVQIWHALGAIKKFGYQSLDTKNGRSSKQAIGLAMHSNYTFAVSPGSLTTSIFREAFNCEIKEFKLPIIDYYKKMRVDSNTKKVLYLPTYRDNSQRGVNDVFEMLDAAYEVTYKPHINDINNHKDIVYSQCNLPTFEALKECDILITDYSAAAFEASLLGKKVVFYLWDFENYKKERGVNTEFSTMKNVCYSKDELVPTLENLANSAYIEENYLDAKDDFINYLRTSLQK